MTVMLHTLDFPWLEIDIFEKVLFAVVCIEEKEMHN